MLGSWFGAKKHLETALLIDIGSASVAGAYASFPANGTPIIHYTRRVTIEPHEKEDPGAAMARALSALCDDLVARGAPALVRAVGRGRADSVLVSISAPWQSTSLHHEHFEQAKPFVFTNAMVEKATQGAATAPAGSLLVDESVIGTLLNGYETHRPVGKRTRHATVLVLASFVNESVARRVAEVLKHHFHAEHILSIAGESLRYQALKSAFPHEDEYFIVDATGPEIALGLVRGGLLVSVSESPDGAANSAVWAGEVKEAFSAFSERYPLARTLFLITEPGKEEASKQALDDAKLGEMWLAEKPPRVVPVLASHISAVKDASGEPPDVLLSLMALYWLAHRHDE